MLFLAKQKGPACKALSGELIIFYECGLKKEKYDLF